MPAGPPPTMQQRTFIMLPLFRNAPDEMHLNMTHFSSCPNFVPARVKRQPRLNPAQGDRNIVARKLRIAEPFQADLGRPDLLAKIYRFPTSPNQWLNRAIPTRQEGRIARRHERGTGCGGRESAGAQ